MAKWLVLDMMGVIFEVADDVDDLLIPYIRRISDTISAEKINELYLEASLGRISSFDFWNGLGLGDEYPGVERDYLDICLRIDPEFKGVAEKLSQAYALAILSNDVREWSAYLRTKFDIDRLFRSIVVSGEVGYRKPDEEIYDILLGRTKAFPSDCVFVDDRHKNLRPAKEKGMKTIRFAREESSDSFSADFEIDSFAELLEVVGGMFS